MYSIREVAQELGVTESWVRKWVRLLGLGAKVGWAVILDVNDMNMLRKRLHGSQEAA